MLKPYLFLRFKFHSLSTICVLILYNVATATSADVCFKLHRIDQAHDPCPKGIFHWINALVCGGGNF